MRHLGVVAVLSITPIASDTRAVRVLLLPLLCSACGVNLKRSGRFRLEHDYLATFTIRFEPLKFTEVQ